jgi:hypothetical protein
MIYACGRGARHKCLHFLHWNQIATLAGLTDASCSTFLLSHFGHSSTRRSGRPESFLTSIGERTAILALR